MKKIYSILLLLVVSFSAEAQCTGPTAVCQDITVYLDAAGGATILDSDIDNGSTDDCATGVLNLSASQTAFTCADLSAGGGGGLVISGTYDGPLSGGHPKGIELYAGSAIADLSNYGVGSANNGGGTDGEEFTFPAVPVAAGTFIYIAADSTGFHNFFGFAPDYESNSMGINGDDAVELFQGGIVIDVFGDINMDGSGTAWDHLDGWAYRNNLQAANGGVFVATNWSYSGPNALDLEISNATATTPFPIGTFTPASSGLSITLTVTDGNGDADVCTALVTILDTLAPMPDMAMLADETAACEVLILMAPTATDNCTGPITGTTATTFPISVSTLVTWIYDDGNGNTTTQGQNVIISDNVAPVADSVALLTLVDDCEVSPTAPTATDNCVGSIAGTTTTSFPVTASTTITWTFDDGNGNTVTQDQIVTINGLDVSTVLVITTIIANATGVTYQWIDCSTNSPIAGETNQSFTATITGDYAVIINNGTCSDTSVCENVLVTTCAGPMAVCQNIDIYLDASGNATIADADIDGGSVDFCTTGVLTLAASQTAFTCANLGYGTGVELIITGAYDGPLSGGHPKGIELYTGTGIADLSNYGVGSANNGGGTDGVEYTFPAVSVPAGTFIYVAADSAGFHNFFGFAADYESGASMGINGDDAVELFEDSIVIDVFGDINMDGSGTAWDHLDGWAYRNNLQAVNGGVFLPANWSFSGINAFDGETTNATAVTPFPIGTFTAANPGALVDLTVTDGLANTDVCTAIVSVYDTLVPMADVATLADETASCEVTTLTAPTATDNCSGAITGTTTTTFPITTSGITVVTWSYVDASGNTSTQDQNVIIDDAIAPVADVATLADLSDDCEVSPTAPTATDNCTGAITGTTTTTFPVTASTTITWTYTDASGNTSTQDQIVTINGLDVTVTIQAPSPTVIANATGVTYQWIDCADSSAIVGETAQSFTATSTGDYAVIITNGTCSDTSVCSPISVTGIDEIIDLGMTVSPNPSAGIFNVSFENTVSGIVTIVDANGRLIQTQELNNNSISIDLTSNQSGLYLMQVATENGISRERIVKF
jgi:hypothetical protein